MKKLLLSTPIITSIFVIGCNNGAMPIDAPPTPTPTPTPSYCTQNVANFDSLANTSLIGSVTDTIWGPNLAVLPFPTNLTTCQTSTTWNQLRVLAGVNYWVGQKHNYCHHHVPTWNPSTGNTPNIESSYAMCSTNTDVMPPIPSESMIRWNYTGTGTESANAWYQYDNTLGYAIGNYGQGLDCSDYTKLIYSYTESIIFTSGIALQGGQSSNQSTLAPNMTGFVDATESDPLGLYSAGQLVCNDGTVTSKPGATSSSCNSHGGYISVFESSGTYNESAISDQVLANLQPGDLLYIAGCASNPNASNSQDCGFNPRTMVTHVIIWTGQKIGSSTLIGESQIAPQVDKDAYGITNQQCGTLANPDMWSAANNIGNWIISDSHYQGPDYRAFTYCFYRNQVWGVRRVLN